MKLGPVAEFEVRHWLGTLRAADADGPVRELVRRARIARSGGPRCWHVCGARWPGPLALTAAPEWTVHVQGEDATLRTLPFGQAWQIDLSELLALLFEWFDETAPDVATQLRVVNGEDMRPPRRPPTAAMSIAAVAAITVPSIAAVESALEVPLPLMRSAEGLQEHRAEFTDGALSSAAFFHNRHTDAATATLVPRVSSPEALDARELGWSAAFDGFNFERPGEVRRQFRASFGGHEMRLVEPAGAGGLPVVTITWQAVRRNAPLPRCVAPPLDARRIENLAGLRTPGRYWLTMRFDGEGWFPDPAIKLPAGVALRVELQNLAEFPGVAAHRRDRLRFHVHAVSRESRRVAGGHDLRETLFVRVIEVCVDESRDV